MCALEQAKSQTTQRGFIALMATIIIGTIMLLLTATLARSGYNVRAQVMGMEQKMLSRSVADGCAVMALGSRLVDLRYDGDTSTRTASSSCYISPLVHDTEMNHLTFQVEGIVQQAHTVMEYQYDVSEIYSEPVPLGPESVVRPVSSGPRLVYRRELTAMP